MPYVATVLPIMIASPGDVHEYRAIARDVIHEWNYIYSPTTGAVLMPVGWETHSSPELGSSAQELINDRVLEDCDLLVGIFWTRLGTPTGKAASGTVEEIERHVAAGKPAMVYFSTAPASLETVAPEQYAALKEFRTWCQSQGIIESFSNALDFQGKFRRHLQIALQKNAHLKSLLGQSSLNGEISTLPSGSIALTDPREELASSLSEEGRTLLLEASEDRGGTILKLATLGGRFIQTNGKTLGDPGDRRSSARWEFALDQLISAGLVIARGHKDEVFEMAEPGYQLAEFLKQRAA
ncbi:MAG: hypothetical protein ACSLE5_11450 [Porticoccaceae bacterium]